MTLIQTLTAWLIFCRTAYTEMNDEWGYYDIEARVRDGGSRIERLFRCLDIPKGRSYLVRAGILSV